MKLINKTTHQVILEFKENDQPIFYDANIGRELFDFGIQIPPELRGPEFNNTTTIRPSQNEKDIAAMQLFKKALIEIHYNPTIMNLCNLEWIN